MPPAQQLTAIRHLLALRSTTETLRIRERDTLAGGPGNVLAAGVDPDYDRLGAGIKQALVDAQGHIARNRSSSPGRARSRARRAPGDDDGRPGTVS